MHLRHICCVMHMHKCCKGWVRAEVRGHFVDSATALCDRLANADHLFLRCQGSLVQENAAGKEGGRKSERKRQRQRQRRSKLAMQIRYGNLLIT